MSALTLGACSSEPDPSTELGGINMGEALNGILARTQQIMSNVNSTESAKKANKELIRVSQDYDDLLYHVPQMSEEGRVALAKQAQRALPELQELARQINDMPALADIMGETLNEMAEKLAMVR